MRDAVMRCAAGAGVLATACGWPEGLPNDSSYTDDTASGDASTTTSSSSDPPESTSTGVGTTTSGPDSSSTNDDGVGFIMEPDGGSKNIECSLWKNDCPRGEKCMPWANDGGNAWNATKCTPIARAPNQPGEPCTVVESGVSGIDDCVERAMCWNVDSRTGMGVCISFCTGSEANPICEDPSTHCNIMGDGVLLLCFPQCDPLAQDCSEGQGCYPENDYFDCAPDVSDDGGAAGDPCEFLNVCDPSLFCANADLIHGCASTGCCAPFCDLSDPQCPLFTECVPWYEDGQAPFGYENVGGCLEGA